MSASPASTERGFTLLELLIALTLAGTAVLIAHQIFGTASRGVESLRTARRELDASSNARRWLASAFGSLEVGRPGNVTFEGVANGVTFSTYLLTERGWFEPGTVHLIEARGTLVARTSRGAVELAHDVAGLRVDYLLEPGANARWISAWSSPVSAPLAVRLRISQGLAVDTMLFLIGPRG